MGKKISGKPERFYALHMAEGLAEYRDPSVNDGKPFRILIRQEVANQMDSTFEGCPVYVYHEDDVNLEKLDMSEVDGIVSKSFFSQPDGNNWVEFLAITDNAKDAIKVSGWKVSNCHITDDKKGGGKWQGMDYQWEVGSGHYEHLAIVPNPRYTQSIVLTPEEFAEYNAKKVAELTKLKNSSDDETTGANSMKFSFFKKDKVQNSDELSTMSVLLPKSKKEVEISKLINDADESALANGKPVMANGDHMVKVGEKEMCVNDLVKAYNELAEKKNAKSDEEVEEMAEDIKEHEEKEIEDKSDKSENDKDDKDEKDDKKVDKDKSKNEDEDDMVIEDKKTKGANFNKLKNAEQDAVKKQVKHDEPARVYGADRVKLGQTKYGSAK